MKSHTNGIWPATLTIFAAALLVLPVPGLA
jgi:hypothetical protein